MTCEIYRSPVGAKEVSSSSEEPQLVEIYEDHLILYASAFIINSDFTSGQETQKEYSSEAALKLEHPRAFEEGRVIWPCPGKDPHGMRNVLVSRKSQERAYYSNSALAKRLENIQKKSKALGISPAEFPTQKEEEL